MSTTQAMPRDFWLYRFGQAVSVIGDSCGAIALAWWILGKTGSAAAMSSVLAPAMAARIFLLPLFGPLADRFSRKALVVASDLWRGGLMLSIAALVAMDYYSLPAVVGLYVLSSIGSALFSSASSSIVPQLVPAERIPEAIQKSQAIEAVGGILGGIIGGIVVSAIGVKGAFLVDGVSFLCAALASAGIKANTKPQAAAPSREAPLSTWARDLAQGFQFVYRIPVVFWLCLVAMMINFALAPLSILLPVLVKEGRGLPPWFLGALESSIGVGTIAGALSLAWLNRRLSKDLILSGALAMIGLGVAMLPLMPTVALPLVVMFWLGLGASLANVALGSQVAVAIPNRYRGRMSSIMSFMCSGIAPIGVAASGALVDGLGLKWSLLVIGMSVMVLTPLLFAVPRLAEFLRAETQDAGPFLARNFPKAFAEDESPAPAVMAQP